MILTLYVAYYEERGCRFSKTTVFLTFIPPSLVSEFHSLKVKLPEGSLYSDFPMISSGLGCYYYCMRFIATISEVCYGLDAAIDMRKNHGFKFRLGVPTRRQGLQTVPLLDISSDLDWCHPVTYVVFSDLEVSLIGMSSYEH